MLVTTGRRQRQLLTSPLLMYGFFINQALSARDTGTLYRQRLVMHVVQMVECA